MRCARARLHMAHAAQVETRLYQLLAQAKQIANEQAYQRVRPPPRPRGLTPSRRAK